MIVAIDVDCENNESTSSPWWVVIDPRRNHSKRAEAAHNIAGMVTGPFFSRDAAQGYLDGHRYNFGPGAVVFCMSGCYSKQYSDAIKSAKGKHD